MRLVHGGARVAQATPKRAPRWSSRSSCYARAVVKRSAKAMANWFIAADHSRVARLQSLVMLRSASQISLVAASSDGKMAPVFDDLAQLHVKALDHVGNRHDIARCHPIPRLGRSAYGVTIRDRGTGEHEAWAGRSIR